MDLLLDRCKSRNSKNNNMKQTPLYESLKMTYEREREIVNSLATYFQQGKILGDILLELSQRKDLNAKEKIYLALMIGSMMSKPNEEK
jgi:hypothetical protein